MARPRAGTPLAPASVDIAFITILREEYEAIRNRLKNPKRAPSTSEQPNQYAWLLGEIERAEGGSYQVVLALAARAGNTSGSLATSKTIARWNPRYVLLVGIAGGLKREGLTLGDVVVSSLIRAYEYGKLKSHFEPRPDFQHKVDGSLLRSALALNEVGWRKGLPVRPGRLRGVPKMLVGPVASGDKVVDDVSASFFAAVVKAFPRLQAVEMEGAGAAAAIDEAQEEGRSVGFLMIRGISDMPPEANAKRKQPSTARASAGGTEIRARWKKYAAEVAASFAVCLVAHGWPVPPVGAVPEGTGEHVTAVEREAARARYLEYLQAECGEIRLDGLPADESVGSRRLPLETLFVPLHVVPCRFEAQDSTMEPPDDVHAFFSMVRFRDPKKDQRRTFGAMLAETSRVALLAPPGGGKSTLLKRLAMAYAVPDRRRKLDDQLPDRRWFPVLLRCRELKARADQPFHEFFTALAERAEMKELQPAFLALIDTARAAGSLLLLIDGLDEISDEGPRSAFVRQLHTYLELHPTVSLVVTSREAGFRVVASTVASLCQAYRLAEFSDEEIEHLTVAWHREVVGDKTTVIEQAKRLAASICENDRVQRLAQNPLLLTTLLLVRRWVGELPRQRSVLYQKAIEVLLMSWNREAHEVLETSEALPQLGFLAFTMMKEGIEQVSEQRLRAILNEARQQMEEFLAYARIGIEDFIRRVEHRSSLLVQSGHTLEDGRLWPLYEFRHLTFQEYLAAHAVAEGHYPGHQEGDTVLRVLRPHIGDGRWREIIPLAAVLAGRHAKSLVEHLTELCETRCLQEFVEEHPLRVEGRTVVPFEEHNVASLLGQCLIDEVPLPLALVERALLAGARAHSSLGFPVSMLVRGRYRETLKRIVQDEFMKDLKHFGPLGSAVSCLGEIWWQEMLEADRWDEAARQLEEQFRSDIPFDQASAALTLMQLAYKNSPAKSFRTLVSHLEPLLGATEPAVRGAAAWTYAWLGERGIVDSVLAKRILPQLFQFWNSAPARDLQIMGAFAISALPLIARDAAPLSKPTAIQLEWLKIEEQQEDMRRKFAAWVLAYYWRRPWPDEELASRISEKWVDLGWSRIGQILTALGAPGAPEPDSARARRKSRRPRSNVR